MNRKLTKQKFTFWEKMMLSPEIGILVPVLIMCAIAYVMNHNFLKITNLAYIINSSAFYGFLALAECVVQLTGDTDLSVGMNGAIASVIVGVAAQVWGLSPVMALLCGIAMGALVGLVNGLISAKFGLSLWITSLATQFMCSGFAQFISMGKPFKFNNEAFAEGYKAIADFKNWVIPKLGINTTFIIFVVMVAVLHFVVHKTQFGYKLRAVGGNPDAALLAGINVSNIKLIACIVAGAICGVYGGAVVLKQLSTNIQQGQGGEFRAITCCALGGITAGAGSVWSVFMGVLLFHFVNGALQSMGADNNVQLAMVGVLLLFAVLLNVFRQNYMKKKTI